MNYLQPAGMRGLSKGQQIYGLRRPTVKGRPGQTALFCKAALKEARPPSILRMGAWATPPGKGVNMKYLYITIIFLIFAVPVVNSCIPSPMGPSNPAITGCQATVAANLSLTLFPCGQEGEVIVRSQADYISKLCLDPANPSPPAPCDFSAYMLVGEPLGGGCAAPSNSYPTVCY
ncbi:MAG TPA: hypothetical protein VNZ67_03780, partial [bacterium]|nr:hypothetical protein [bacterium]